MIVKLWLATEPTSLNYQVSQILEQEKNLNLFNFWWKVLKIVFCFNENKSQRFHIFKNKGEDFPKMF